MPTEGLIVDDHTEGRDYPVPNAQNWGSVDAARLAIALAMIDADIVTALLAIAGKAAAIHGHAIDDITGLQAVLNTLAADDHQHNIADILGVDVAASANGMLMKLVNGVWMGAVLTLADLDGASFNADVIDETASRKWLTSSLKATYDAAATSVAAILAASNPAVDTFTEVKAALDAITSDKLSVSAVNAWVLNNFIGASSQANARAALDAAGLTTARQALVGGFTPTSLVAALVGTVTLEPGDAPHRHGTNNAAFTLAAPTTNGGYDLLVTNGASAGAITFSGFTVSSDIGDALSTTNGRKFLLMVRRINGTSTYMIKALQ